MARRNEHSPEELRALILHAARAIIQEEGIGALSMRKLSRRVNYTEGTIYQYFENKHALVLAVNAKTLADFENTIRDLPLRDDPKAQLSALAERYVEDVLENRELWLAIFEYSTDGQYKIPKSYQKQIDDLIDYVVACLKRMPHAEGVRVEHRARLLWASVHSVCVLQAGHKLSMVIQEPLSEIVEEMIDIHCLAFRNQGD